MSKVEAKAMTVKAVIAYAAKLEAEALHQIAADPYASPYRPPTSEDAIRKLCQRQNGPEGAIVYLRSRAAMHAVEAREHAVAAQASLKRHAQRQAKHRLLRERERGHLNPGQRIDHAIARLRVVASTASSTIGGDLVHGGEKNQRPAFTVDAAAKAIVIAGKAVREIEALEDQVKVREFGKAA